MNLRTGKLITRREFNKISATQAIMKRAAQLVTKQQVDNDLIVYDFNQIPIPAKHEVNHSQDDDHFTGVDDHDEDNDSNTEPNYDNLNDEHGNEEEEETAHNDNNDAETLQPLHNITG
eukprot:1555222-Ditylum_brightwellii.AAC.1